MKLDIDDLEGSSPQNFIACGMKSSLLYLKADFYQVYLIIVIQLHSSCTRKNNKA